MEAAKAFVNKTGTGLSEKVFSEDTWPVSHSKLFLNEQALAVYLSDQLFLRPSDKYHEVYGALYRTVARYSVSKSRHTLQDYDALLREYNVVERKRRRRRATSIDSPSKEYIKVCLEEARSEVEDLIDQINSNIEAFTVQSEAKKLASREWLVNDEIAHLDNVISELREKVGDISKSIVEANKEDREKSRLRVAIIALFSAILVGSIPNMIPEASKQIYWAETTIYLSSFGAWVCEIVNDLLVRSP